MNKHHKINYVEFAADDLAAVKKFYNKAFGWKFTDYGSEYTAFNGGNLDGGFFKGSPKEAGPLVILYSETLEESLKIVEDNGGVVVKQIFSFPGGRRFHFKDPAGNELAIWSDV